MLNIVNELHALNVYFKWLIFCYMTFNSIKKKNTSIIPNIHSKYSLSLMSHSLGIN